MRIKIPSSFLILFAASAISLAGIPEAVEDETSLLLEKVKSPEAAVREQGVHELVGIRESVSVELRQIVSDANAGRDTSNSAAKASSLYLMGVWGLLQCRDVLEAERNWRYAGERPDGTVPLPTHRIISSGKFGATAKTALGAARFGGGVTLAPSRAKADLSAYPALSKALTGLRSRENALFEQSETEMYWWYTTVSDGLEDILTLYRGHLYSDDVKMTAAFVAGEYRIWTRLGLSENIYLHDEKGLTTGYPSFTIADTPDSAYPCVAALVKCGGRADFETFVHKMGDASCSQESRERIARALKVIDPEFARKKFEGYYDDIQAKAARIPDSSEILSRLASVRSIIGQP